MIKVKLILSLLLLMQENGLVLTEDRLGPLDLRVLEGKNISQQLQKAFPTSQVIRGVGQQDGPDFVYYDIKHQGEEFFTVMLNTEDSSRVSEIWISSNRIKDQHGITLGSSLESLREQLPDLRLYADLHQNIFASTASSKILYRISANLKPLNDSTFVAPDHTIQPWQVEAATVEHLVWRKDQY